MTRGAAAQSQTGTLLAHLVLHDDSPPTLLESDNRAEEPHPAERIGAELVLGLHKVTQQVPNQRMPL